MSRELGDQINDLLASAWAKFRAEGGVIVTGTGVENGNIVIEGWGYKADSATPADPTPPTQEELLRYAGLLAWIMEPEDDRDEVVDTAVHVWRVSLTREQHKRLMRFLPYRHLPT